MKDNKFKSRHNLSFECGGECAKGMFGSSGFQKFRVGTCEGLWRCNKDTYEILAVANRTPKNGHFDDLLDWFENSCKRDKKKLAFLQIFNKKLMRHLTGKRKFKEEGTSAIKTF